MARYGNILSLYNCSDTDAAKVIPVLQNKQVIFQQVAHTFFIESTSKDNTVAVVDGIRTLQLRFTFFHDSNPFKSKLYYSDDMDPQVIAAINKILFD